MMIIWDMQDPAMEFEILIRRKKKQKKQLCKPQCVFKNFGESSTKKYKQLRRSRPCVVKTYVSIEEDIGS